MLPSSASTRSSFSFYTKALCIPALFGIYVWFHTGKNQPLDDKLFVMNSLVNIVWATGFLIFWRRKQAELAHQWNTLGMEEVDDTREAFKGELRPSPITKKFEPYYPAWKRLLFRLLVTIPMLMINIVLVSFLILGIIRFQSWIDRQLRDGRLPGRHDAVNIGMLSHGGRCFRSVDVIDWILTEDSASIGHYGLR